MSNSENDSVHMTQSKLNYCSFKKPVVKDATDQKIMKMIIDGKEVEFYSGDTIMQAAERAKISDSIPRYCYHPGLPIAGTCRMCTVEVEKMPKLMTSCSTPAGEGMIVHTKSEKVLKSRNGVMEFLLTNHPLDCPVCDKAGECELQNYNFEYGPSTSRFQEDKRVFENATTKKLSDKITLNMNRCVHCERCVRFTEDVTKSYDLVMENRGWKKELCVTDEERGLWNNYQGNLADFCPVGALTFNDFRFNKRVWFLDKRPSICDGCSKGCNIEVHSDKEVVYRYYPLFNEKVNGHWICDEGRVSYNTTVSTERVTSPIIIQNQQTGKIDLHSTSWEVAIDTVVQFLIQKRSTLFVIGTDATMEEAKNIKEFADLLSFPILSYNGTNGVMNSKDDQAQDHLLMRKDKTSNTKGIEALGISAATLHHFSQFERIVFFRSGRTHIPDFQRQKLVLWGVWSLDEVKRLGDKVQLVLPGLTTIEKSGSFINCDGIKQSFNSAVTHLANGLSVDLVTSKIKTRMK